jgi:hypothetical protein
MPDNFLAILMFILFIVAPLIERVLKGRANTPPPPPRPRVPREADEDAPSAPTGTRLPRRADSGDGGMMPDELWEILTGERRPRAGPLPHEPAEIDVEWEPRTGKLPSPWGDEADVEDVSAETYADEIGDENEAAEQLRRARERGVHTAERAPAYELGPVISLEGSAEVGPLRHVAFHERLRAQEQAIADMKAAASAQARGRRLTLGRLPELQRAMVLAELFGRPRGMDPR